MPADLDGLQPELRAALVAAEDDLRRQGILLESHVTSGYRSVAEQQDIIRRYEAGEPGLYMPARAGSSPHNRGAAVDIARRGWGDEQWQAVQDTLHRYGLSRPYPDRDPVHWQLTHPGQAARPEPPQQQVFPQVNLEYRPGSGQEAEGQYPTDGTMLPMASTMLAAAGYRADTRELICEFVKTGRIYTYLGVPEDVWTGLVDAGSKGSYMRAAVIGVYAF
jgi:KTSC domain/D-alanyl-D-alanine carboxypeptidase